MSIVPQGMSVQQIYKIYREGNLWVNRRYQRKLVWDIEEKQFLIDSMLKGYPIPLVLLAKRGGQADSERYEIIDGMQRLNAILSFIENSFPLTDGKYFDVKQLARAQQASNEGLFKEAKPDLPRLEQYPCANLLDYQLAVTVYPAPSEEDINEVFGRINSSGRQLSDQERRQAGVMTPFAELVRKLAAELRGDASLDVLNLEEMPSISLDSRRMSQGYGLQTEDIFWCKQGILRTGQLRNSEDEQMLADICASILLNKPIGFSGELMDKIYDSESEQSKEVESALAAYSAEKLSAEVRSVSSILVETIESVSSQPNYLRKTVAPEARSNPIKTPFYSIFMAFFELTVHEQKIPADPAGVVDALSNLTSRLTISKSHASEASRQKNINVTKGLIDKFFTETSPHALGHGIALATDFENSLRRSAIETPRYEFKQGIYNLDAVRTEDPTVISRFVEHICGIANACQEADGYFFIGVADSESDAKKIETMDSVKYIKVGQHHVVGIDREVKLTGGTLEKYVSKILNVIRNSKLSESLKTQVLNQVDTVLYRGHSVIRIKIPRQHSMSFIGEDAFYREGNQTLKASGPKIAAIQQLFSQKKS